MTPNETELSDRLDGYVRAYHQAIYKPEVEEARANIIGLVLSHRSVILAALRRAAPAEGAVAQPTVKFSIIDESGKTTAHELDLSGAEKPTQPAPVDRCAVPQADVRALLNEASAARWECAGDDGSCPDCGSDVDDDEQHAPDCLLGQIDAMVDALDADCRACGGEGQYWDGDPDDPTAVRCDCAAGQALGDGARLAQQRSGTAQVAEREAGADEQEHCGGDCLAAPCDLCDGQPMKSTAPLVAAGDGCREALRELVAVQNLKREAAKLFAGLDHPDAPEIAYTEYSDMAGEIHSRGNAAWEAARAALAQQGGNASPQADGDARPNEGETHWDIAEVGAVCHPECAVAQLRAHRDAGAPVEDAVPREPTQAMINAAKSQGSPTSGVSRNLWQAMYNAYADAAPAPPVAAGDGCREALRELVDIDDMKREAARLFATLHEAAPDADYARYSDMSSEIERRRKAAMPAARAALAAPATVVPPREPTDAYLVSYGGDGYSAVIVHGFDAMRDEVLCGQWGDLAGVSPEDHAEWTELLRDRAEWSDSGMTFHRQFEDGWLSVHTLAGEACASADAAPADAKARP